MRNLIVIFLLFLLACNNQGRYSSDKISADSVLLVIDSLNDLSWQHYRQTNKTVVEDEYINSIIDLAKKYGLERSLFQAYLNLAKRYRTHSDHVKAIENLQLAQEIANKLDNDTLRAKVSHNIAVNFRRLNENGKALKYHTEALELAESASDTFLIHCSHNGIGNVYFHYKHFDKAVKSFHRSLDFIGKNKPNWLGKAINANLLGESWLFLGNKDSAIYYLQQSFHANEQINSEMGKGVCYNGMGLVYLEFHDYGLAIREFKKAIHIFDSLQLKYYKSMALSGLGEAYIAINELDKAETALKETFRLADEIGGKRFALDASTKLAGLYNKRNELAKSFKYSQIALAYKDSVTDELERQNTEAMNVLYKAEKQEREIIDLKYQAEISRIKLTRQRFIFALAVILTLVAAIIVYLTFRQKRLQNKISEISLEQKLLRAQLNPHFVFNSLSAVQNFILKNNKESASEYLVNFSRLMRNILMGSGEDFIALENELEMLDDYLKLQHLRFRGKFDFSFKVADAIDIKSTHVPPMLVQPFVENSLEHGIRFIDYQGEIIVSFELKKDMLAIAISDNGKGLNDQEEAGKKKGHISMATKITRQRMEILQATTGKRCYFEVLDRKKIENKNGVLVNIIVPYIND